MGIKQLTQWFMIVSAILVGWGIVFTFFGLGILPVLDREVLLPWESALYGAIMTGWGVTLFQLGRVAFRRKDAELMKIMWVGIFIWLLIEGLFSAYFKVWFNVGVDIAVLALFSFPLLKAMQSIKTS